MTPHPLDEVTAFLRRYVILPDEHALVAVVLWVAHAHAIEAAEATAYLSIQSPDKRCGKTRLLEVLHELVPNAIFTVGASEAALFRIIDRDPTPTLLVDEIDTVFGPKAKRENESLRGLINAGHRRGSTYLRCSTEGKTPKVEQYRVFCAKVLAGIGEPPDTITDRSIIIRMRRKAPGERVERLRNRTLIEAAHPLRQRLSEWTGAVLEAVHEARPDLPSEIDDRAQDGWEPLLALADIAGGDWPERARAAAIALSAGRGDTDQDSLGIRLLSEVRDVFDGLNGTDRIASKDLVAALREMELAPWATLNEHGLTDRGLAGLLRHYDIKPAVLRIGDSTPRGYQREQFTDAWARYCPTGTETPKNPPAAPPPPDKRNNRNNAMDKPIQGNQGAQHRTPVLRTENTREPQGQAVVADVAVKAGGNGHGGLGAFDMYRIKLTNIVRREPSIAPLQAAMRIGVDHQDPVFIQAYQDVARTLGTVTR